MKMVLYPYDVLMFRDFRSFTAGEDVVAKSILPMPHTLAGAIRTKLYLDYGKEVYELIGYKRTEPNFMIYGTFLSINGDEIFAFPADIVGSKDAENSKSKLFYIYPHKLYGSEEYLFFAGKYIHYELVYDYFLTKEGLIKYLLGELSETDLKSKEVAEKYIIPSNKVYRKEERVGIALDENKVTKYGFFYISQFLRFEENVGISIWLDDRVKNYLSRTGFLKIGGEGRLARYQLFDVSAKDVIAVDVNELLAKIEKKKKLKIYLATPLVIPDSENTTEYLQKSLEKALYTKIKNIYPLVDKLLPVGGWDLARNKPKEVTYSLSSGSIIFVEFDGSINISEFFFKMGNLQKLGYGLCFIGVWR